jgi:hypothetical protein
MFKCRVMNQIISVAANTFDGINVNGFDRNIHGGKCSSESPTNFLIEKPFFKAHRDIGAIFIDGKCIEPIGESKSEYEIVSAIAEKLGLLEQFTGGESVEQKIRRGFETSGVQDMVTWEEFSQK